jgi:hypothetical protein
MTAARIKMGLLRQFLKRGFDLRLGEFAVAGQIQSFAMFKLGVFV